MDTPPKYIFLGIYHRGNLPIFFNLGRRSCCLARVTVDDHCFFMWSRYTGITVWRINDTSKAFDIWAAPDPLAEVTGSVVNPLMPLAVVVMVY